MNQFQQVCTSILIGLLCILSTHQAHATHVPTAITNLFKVDKASIGTGDFVEDAVFVTINKETLAKIRNNNKDNFTLVIPFENDTKLTLNLEKKSFTASDFKITVAENNTLSTLDYNPAVFYSGAVKGQSNALVALNFFEDKVTGVLSFQGQNYNVGPYERGGEDSFVIYKEQNLNVPNPFECSTEDPVDFHMEPVSSSRSSQNKKVSVYIECDNHLYKNLGSSSARVSDFTTGLFNIVSILYKNEEVELEISEIKIWSTPDPYPNTSAKKARNDFASRLNGNFNGDIAHLLSNYKVNGTPPNGGSANIDVLCDKDIAVSYTNVTTSYLNYPTFSWTAYAVTHEIGHNLGSPHTHSCLWPTGPIDNCWCPEGGCTQGPEPTSSGTIMSYCHLDPGWTTSCSLSSDNPGISFSAGFGRQPGDLIRNKIANASCLSNYTPVVIPFTAAASVRNETCFEEKNGSITLDLENGSSPYTYKWSTGARVAVLRDLSGGSYAVTVTDRNGKIAKLSATVKAAERIIADAGSDKTIACTNGSLVLEANNAFNRSGHSYKWTKIGGALNNSTGNSITITTSGTYVYTVSNNSTGCTARDTVVVTQDQAPVFQIRGNDLNCNTPFAELKVNTNLSDLTYEWTGPNGFTSNVSTPKVDQAGIYYLSVTNASNCVSQDQIVIRSEIYQPDVQAYGGVITCSNTSIELIAESNEQVSYKWSGPNNFVSTVKNPTTEMAGIYTLEVTSLNGCTNTTTAQVGAAIDLPAVRINGGDISCNESFVTLSAISDANNILYQWSGPSNFNSNNGQIQATEAGVYDLVISNGAGCTTSTSYTVNKAGTPNFDIQASPLSCQNSTTILRLTNYDNISYYQWTGPNNFQTTNPQPTVSQGGLYTVVATGTDGCASTKSFTVENTTDLPAVRINGGDISCNESFVTLSAISDANNILYQWSGPSNFSSNNGQIQATEAGVYALIISNGAGCTTSTSYTVNKAGANNFDIQANPLSCQNSTTILRLTNYDNISYYQWTGPNNFQTTNPQPTVSEGGLYTLVATGANGCISTKSFTVENTIETPSIEITAAALTCANNSTQLLTNSTYSFNQYEWVGPNSFRSSETAPFVSIPGTYTLEVSTAGGCVIRRSLLVEADNNPVAILALNATELTCTQTTAQLNVLTNQSTAQYLWTGPNNFQSIEQNPTVTLAGLYELNVIGENGCTNNSRVEVISKSIDINNILVTQDDCGQKEGHIKIEVAGQAADYSVQWNTGQTGFEIGNLAAGIYSATIKDQNGCSVIISQEIKSNDPIMLNNLDVTEITCSGAADGHIAVSVIGGLAPYQLFWSNGETGNAISDLDSGTHTLEVVDARNCVKTFYFDITDPEYLEVTTELEEGGVDFFVEGGNPEYIYEWSNGLSGSSERDLENGDYEVTISDASGCEVVEQFTMESFDITESITADIVTINMPDTREPMVSPNPADTYFKLNYEFEESTLVFISIFNAQGYYLYRSTMESNLINETFNTTSWENGTYYVQLLSKNGFVTEELKVVHN